MYNSRQINLLASVNIITNISYINKMLAMFVRNEHIHYIAHVNVCRWKQMFRRIVALARHFRIYMYAKRNISEVVPCSVRYE